MAHQLSQPILTPSRWQPIPINQLQRASPPDIWIWQGILAPGKITLLSAEAKAGKTTLLGLLCQRMASGGLLCGAQVEPGRLIVVSEEPGDFWIDRRERLGLGNNLEVLSTPFVFKPRQSDWERLITDAAQALRENPASLVVFDTLSHLWWLEDENDNAKLATALMPLRQLCTTGAAVCLVHHFSAEKTGPRGGTELRGFPDLLAELHLFKQGDFSDRRRLLKVRGRLIPLPSQIVIELNQEGEDYAVVEGCLETGRPGIWAVLSSLIPSNPPGFSSHDFHQQWPHDPPPRKKKLSEVLTERWESAGWQRSGLGKKGSPYRYWRPPTDQI